MYLSSLWPSLVAPMAQPSSNAASLSVSPPGQTSTGKERANHCRQQPPSASWLPGSWLGIKATEYPVLASISVSPGFPCHCGLQQMSQSTTRQGHLAWPKNLLPLTLTRRLALKRETVTWSLDELSESLDDLQDRTDSIPLSHSCKSFPCPFNPEPLWSTIQTMREYHTRQGNYTVTKLSHDVFFHQRAQFCINSMHKAAAGICPEVLPALHTYESM